MKPEPAMEGLHWFGELELKRLTQVPLARGHGYKLPWSLGFGLPR